MLFILLLEVMFKLRHCLGVFFGGGVLPFRKADVKAHEDKKLKAVIVHIPH